MNSIQGPAVPSDQELEEFSESVGQADKEAPVGRNIPGTGQGGGSWGPEKRGFRSSLAQNGLGGRKWVDPCGTALLFYARGARSLRHLHGVRAGEQ